MVKNLPANAGNTDSISDLHAVEPLSPRATAVELVPGSHRCKEVQLACTPAPVLCKGSRHGEKSAQQTREQPPLAATRDEPV